MRGCRSVPFIDAVNALQRLGKVDALAALRAYLKLCKDDPDLAFRYDLDHRRVFLIARVLFDIPMDPSAPPLAADDYPYGYASAPTDPNTWPRFPLIVQDDIPFCIDDRPVGEVERGQYSHIDDIAAYLDLCEKSGLIRRTALAPTCTPFEAMDKLTASSRWTNRTFGETESVKALACLRIQVMRAACPLFTHLQDEDWTYLELAPRQTLNSVWSHYVNDKRLKRMKWDAAEQRFEIP